MGYTTKELIKILDGEIYRGNNTDELHVNDFEFAPLPLKSNENNGLCFISISNERWSKENGRELVWRDGNEVALEYSNHFDVLITEEPIRELDDKKIQIIVENSFKVLKILAKES